MRTLQPQNKSKNNNSSNGNNNNNNNNNQKQNQKGGQNQKNIKVITKTSFFQPLDFSLEILSEGDSAKFMNSFNDYIKECRGFYQLSDYLDLGSKDPKKSEVKHKVQPLNMSHILIGLKSIARRLRNNPDNFESVVLIYERESHDILEEVLQLCNRKNVKLILLQKSQRKRMMEITGVKKFNGLGILKFEKTQNHIDDINSYSSKCKSNFTWAINPDELKPLKLKVQTIEKAIEKKKGEQVNITQQAQK
ncbi:hypothetical protein ABPG72_013897 [Tetrahymena utriculariae]